MSLSCDKEKKHKRPFLTFNDFTGKSCCLQVQAHKVVLAACSPFFRQILAHSQNQLNPFFYLKGVSIDDLNSILNFMYNGEVNIAQVRLLQFDQKATWFFSILDIYNNDNLTNSMINYA